LDKTLRSVLAQTAKRAGCFSHVTPHRLRHYAESRTMPNDGVLAAL
jgi:site-specific recombinase XerD